jgi:hypothetical protein
MRDLMRNVVGAAASFGFSEAFSAPAPERLARAFLNLKSTSSPRRPTARKSDQIGRDP